MSRLSTNRASYQHPSNIRLGVKKTTNTSALRSNQREQVRAIQQMLKNALDATNPSFADVNLTNAYRIMRSLIVERIQK